MSILASYGSLRKRGISVRGGLALRAYDQSAEIVAGERGFSNTKGRDLDFSDFKSAVMMSAM